MEERNKPLEVTQQQISILAASVLMIAFFSFVAGYLAMPDRTIVSSTDKYEGDSLLPRDFLRAFAGQALSGAHAGENEQSVGGLPLDSSTSEKKSEKEYYAGVGGFGTVEAARMYGERLKALGIATEIVSRKSETVAGVSRAWFQLIVVGKKEEIEQRARRIQKLAPAVTVVCAEKKERLLP